MIYLLFVPFDINLRDFIPFVEVGLPKSLKGRTGFKLVIIH